MAAKRRQMSEMSGASARAKPRRAADWTTLPTELLQRVVAVGAAAAEEGPHAVAAVPRVCTAWAIATSRARWPAMWARAAIAWSAANDVADTGEIADDDACTTRYGRNEAAGRYFTSLTIVLPAWRAADDPAYRLEVLRAAPRAIATAVGPDFDATQYPLGALQMSSIFENEVKRMTVTAGKDRGDCALLEYLFSHEIATSATVNICNAAAAAGRVDVLQLVTAPPNVHSVHAGTAATLALAHRHGAVLAHLLGGSFSATQAAVAAKAIIDSGGATVTELARCMAANRFSARQGAQLIATLRDELESPAVLMACLAAVFAVAPTDECLVPSQADVSTATPSTGVELVLDELKSVGGLAAFDQLALRIAASNARVRRMQALYAAGARWPEAAGREAMGVAGGQGHIELVCALHAMGVSFDGLAHVSVSSALRGVKNSADATELIRLLAKHGRQITDWDLFETKTMVQRRWCEPVRALLAAAKPADSAAYATRYLDSAVASDDFKLVDVLLHAGAQVNSDALVEAVRNENVAMLQKLVRAGGRDTAVPLREAASAGALECVQTLLPPAVRTTTAFTNAALREAAKAGHADVVQVLLRAGARPEVALADVSVVQAVKNGSHALVRTMLNHGARPDGLAAAIEMTDPELVDLLLSHPDAVVTPEAVEAAAKAGNVECTVRLLKALQASGGSRHGEAGRLQQSSLPGREMECRVPGSLYRQHLDPGGPLDAALWHAASGGHAPVVRLLLAEGAMPNSFATKSLRSSASAGHADVVALLLSAGADVHADEDDALIEAAAHDHRTVVGMLLDAGADVSAQDYWALRIAPGGSSTQRLILERILARAPPPPFSWADESAIKMLTSLSESFSPASKAVYVDVLRRGFGGPAPRGATEAEIRATSLKAFVAAAAAGRNDLLVLLDGWDRRVRASANLASDLFEPAILASRHDTVRLLLEWRADDGIERLPLLRYAAQLQWADVVATIMARGVADDGWTAADVANVRKMELDRDVAAAINAAFAGKRRRR